MIVIPALRKGWWSDMARKSRKNRPDVPMVAAAPVYDTWIYARLSLDSDRAEDSIENQIDICKDYIGGGDDLALRGVYSDTGYTGRDFDRPDFEKLLAGIHGGAVKCLVVKDLSRVGRTYIEVGEFLFDTLPARGVRFISVNDQYDSFADDAARKKLLILFKNLVNHMYSRDLGKKIRSAHAAKKQRGEFSGLPPYGYRRGADGKSLEPDGDAAELVREVFGLRLGGMSANGIAKLLTARRVPSPQQRRYMLGEIRHEKFAGRLVWSVGMITKMLRNETYTGTLVQGKYDCDGKRHTMLPSEMWIRHENSHPAIISRESFEAVQKLMAETAKKFENTGAHHRSENRYAGKIFCGRCGKAASRYDNGKGETMRHTYVCRYCHDELKAEAGVKRAAQLSESALDALVSATLRKQIAALADAERLLAELGKSGVPAQKHAELARERSKWDKAHTDADRTLSAAYTHHLDGLLDFREFDLIRQKASRDKDEAAGRLARAESELAKYDIANARNNEWRRQFGAFRDFTAPTRELLLALVSRIVLTPITNEVNIELNYMDSRAELRDLFTESGVCFDV
jgi:DNA invertase Pin-like site-specific DNA recombinase